MLGGLDIAMVTLIHYYIPRRCYERGVTDDAVTNTTADDDDSCFMSRTGTRHYLTILKFSVKLQQIRCHSYPQNCHHKTPKFYEATFLLLLIKIQLITMEGVL